MKFYYIDDSMFQESQFSQTMLRRFMSYIEEEDTGVIFISGDDEGNESLREFIEYSCRDIQVMMSTALFDIDGLRGNLHTSFLLLDGFPSMQSYSGSCVEYDEDTKQCRRIYFDLFPNHETIDLDLFVEELEEVLSGKIRGFKKKNNMDS